MAVLIRNLAFLVLAAVLELAGCFTFWMWLRRGGSWIWVAVGVASLVGFAVALTRIDSLFAGRAYAAYGGVYIAASLAWLWLVERQPPTWSDLVGAAVAVAGALIIVLGFAVRG